MRRVLAVLLLTSLVSGVSAQSTSHNVAGHANSKCELTSEDYAVYSALIVGLGGPEDPEESWKGKEVVVLNVTEGPQDTKSHWGKWGYRSYSKIAPGHDTEADFERKARSSCVLKPRLGGPSPFRIITKEELDAVFKGGSWQDFYDKYPHAGGVWTFSRPGYNSAHNEAVLSVSHACGELCGTGHLYFLVKQNGEWKVENRLMLWIS